MDAIYPAYSRQQRLNGEVYGSIGKATIITGDLTSGSTGVANISTSDAAKIKNGDEVFGAGAQTTQLTISAHTTSGATLSGNATMAQVGAKLLIVDTTEKVSALDGAAFRLYKNTLTPDEATTLADLVAAEADYTGYVAQTLAMTPDMVNADGNYLAESDLHTFLPSDNVTPNTIGGMWADDGTGALVIWPLDAPKAVSPTNPLKVVVFESYLPPGYEVQVN